MPRLDAIPRRIVTLTLPAPYDIFTVRAWVNYPPDVPTWLPALMDHVIVDHDIEAPDGTRLPIGPQPKVVGAGGAEERGPGLWEALPRDFDLAIMAAVSAQVGSFPPAPSGPSRST